MWFKRDLRLSDHPPLEEAARSEWPLLLCYFFEPSLMADPHTDIRHWRFVYQSLQDMQDRLAKHRARLHLFHSEVRPALALLQEHYDIKGIFSHQETGIKLTFDRDLAVKEFCKQHGIPWTEHLQDGVRRGAKNRKGWEERWDAHMQASVAHVVLKSLKILTVSADLLSRLSPESLPKDIQEVVPDFQLGGESQAWQTLRSFLTERVVDYIKHLSKPQLSRESCSRLSPYIAYGNLSVRQICQLAESGKSSRRFERPLTHFRERVWWRSHYIQKLESLDSMEFEPTNRGFASMERSRRADWLKAWCDGQTGVPMVDASMRCLQATGYLNFRMRAMLVTFASYTLWLDWRPVAHHLARLFLDFEPGIHYGQIHMQAGLTGYHTLRIFNPIIQCQQHDSDGAFVYKWVPELRKLPVPILFEPWKMTFIEQEGYGLVLGRDYPAPLVDYEEGTRQGRDRYWEFRQSKAVKQALPGIWLRLCLMRNWEKYEEELSQNTKTAE
ncbi:MAG: FAD-binding domain-containing protein [Bacteroidota bacterium]